MLKKLSNPGGLGQESETKREHDDDQPQVSSADAIPPSAVAGVADKSGEVIDDSAKAIGETKGDVSKNQGGRTHEKQAEGAPSSVKGVIPGDKASADVDISRQDTSANALDHTSAKGSAETPSPSALKDKDTCPSVSGHESSAVDKTRETKTPADVNVKDVKSNVDAPVQDETPDEPMVIKSPTPIDEDAESETKPTDAAAKQASDPAVKETSEQVTDNDTQRATDKTSDQTSATATEMGPSVGAADQAPGHASLEDTGKHVSQGKEPTADAGKEDLLEKNEAELAGKGEEEAPEHASLEDTGKHATQGEEPIADAGKEDHLEKSGADLAGKGEEELKDTFNILKGAKVNKAGNVVDSDGDVVARLVEGDAKQLLGKEADESGNFLDESGNVIGRAEPLPAEPEPAEEEQKATDFNILKGAKVNKAGNVVDSDGDIVARLVEGDAKKLLGKEADESGNFFDESGNVIGRAELLPAEEEQEPIDYSILKGTKVNKAGNLVDKNGDVVGRLVEGQVKHLLGKTADESGNIWNDSGNIIGRAEPLPDDERAGDKDFAPFENFPDATVEADGRVMSEGRQVGTVIEGDPKRLKGSRVDEDGDILDRRGNVVGKAEAWDEPEEEVQAEVDRSMLAGKRVNKVGNVVDSAGVIYGRVIEGNVASLVGRMCNKDGNVMSESGEVIGKAELVPEHEREGSRDGPFAELVGCTVTKDGKVVTAAGDVVGRLTSGDGKTLFGRSVDEDGDVVDHNGNVLGKAERWEEPEVEKRRDPLAGRRVNREGNIVDEDGNLIGKLVSGDLAICAGMEVDEDGDVVNSKGTAVGHVSRLEDIPPEPEPEPETETAEEKEAREQAEKDRKLAGQLSATIEQSLDKIRPICKMITDKIDSAERKPKDELDEEQLVKEVKPLIEEGHRVLTETNGAIRGLDPDGRIQRNAKQKAGTRDATPEEHHLAEVLKELTGTVSQTIDNARRKIEGMPHAKKELNPLWGLLSEPLFQILAAVGLLLNGVLGLVGRLLGGLGLGGLVDKLLGGLGLNKILGSLGLGGALDALTGKKK
ncbi:hypothetical protein G6O67_001729 [Ophiocordyceps sinensis]|uniref:DUF6987 domain-containing protein n=2 Tax=Ophiocordyceps sinensis TaxID=72228 RepID=A0A8H4V950_9HYPO|nr:hypothetical protein G6O67_001729 [Ophiocordyceps sinensis]